MLDHQKYPHLSMKSNYLQHVKLFGYQLFHTSFISIAITRKEIADSDIIERSKTKDKACLMKVLMCETNSDPDQGWHLFHSCTASYLMTVASINFRGETANWKRKEGWNKKGRELCFSQEAFLTPPSKSSHNQLNRMERRLPNSEGLPCSQSIFLHCPHHPDHGWKHQGWVSHKRQQSL